MMLRLSSTIAARTVPFLTKFTPYFPCSYTVDPHMEHFTEIALKQHRRLHLNQAVLNQNKDVTYAELRKHSDKILDLKNKGKCPGVISRLSGKIEDEIDVVLDGRKMRKMTKLKSYGVDELYVRVDGKEIRCIFQKASINPGGFIEKCYLKEYIVGEPNKLRVPVQLTHVTENPYIRQGSEFNWKLDWINILCYNKEYPRKFYIDVSFCCPERPYRVGDLANTFPPGVVIDPSLSLSDKICLVKHTSQMSQDMRQARIKEIVNKNKKKEKEKPAQGGAAASSDKK